METISRGTPDRQIPAWYVTGFIEGEGAFTYSRSGRQIALYFAVKSPDLLLLQDLQNFFGGAGRIYAVASKKPNHYFRVTRREELDQVVEHFDEYPLRGPKKSVFDIWREMVLLKQDFRKPDRPRLESLALELSAQKNA